MNRACGDTEPYCSIERSTHEDVVQVVAGHSEIVLGHKQRPQIEADGESEAGDDGTGHDFAKIVEDVVDLENVQIVQQRRQHKVDVERGIGVAEVRQLFTVSVSQRLSFGPDSWQRDVEHGLDENVCDKHKDGRWARRRTLLDNVVAVQVSAQKNHVRSQRSDDDVAFGLCLGALDELLQCPGSVRVERNPHKLRRGVLYQDGALLVVHLLQQLLDEVVAERIDHQLNHVELDLVEDLGGCLGTADFQLPLQKPTPVLVLAQRVNVVGKVVERGIEKLGGVLAAPLIGRVLSVHVGRRHRHWRPLGVWLGLLGVAIVVRLVATSAVEWQRNLLVEVGDKIGARERSAGTAMGDAHADGAARNGASEHLVGQGRMQGRDRGFGARRRDRVGDTPTGVGHANWGAKRGGVVGEHKLPDVGGSKADAGRACRGERRRVGAAEAGDRRVRLAELDQLGVLGCVAAKECWLGKSSVELDELPDDVGSGGVEGTCVLTCWASGENCVEKMDEFVPRVSRLSSLSRWSMWSMRSGVSSRSRFRRLRTWLMSSSSVGSDWVFFANEISQIGGVVVAVTSCAVVSSSDESVVWSAIIVEAAQE
ncbi:hypothetical protein OGATHE_004650 [Ogataea polymorpha]|uniref:Uncharacterized protein n=1 Tax=Ogataea polymorpha TaxID=460523 RepID=A0A9P8P1Q8_9ASCO|nr:hypothetical protein OGATHE_004650 [Ogataea polymorpha]